MTWGQYEFPFTPLVDRYKWLEPRHMVNISDRWNRDKTNDLQFAFFNGVGWESWENILGIWNRIMPRDAEATRRGATIERAFAPFFVSEGWQPMVPTLRYGVYASRWPHGEQTLFKVVNRNEYDMDGDQWRSDESSCNPGSALFRFLPRRRAQAGCPGCGALVDPFPDRSQGVRSRPRNQRGTKCSTQGCVGENETAHQHSVGELLA